jgi:hypothetical protein
MTDIIDYRSDEEIEMIEIPMLIVIAIYAVYVILSENCCQPCRALS